MLICVICVIYSCFFVTVRGLIYAQVWIFSTILETKIHPYKPKLPLKDPKHLLSFSILFWIVYFSFSRSETYCWSCYKGVFKKTVWGKYFVDWKPMTGTKIFITLDLKSALPLYPSASQCQAINNYKGNIMFSGEELRENK